MKNILICLMLFSISDSLNAKLEWKRTGIPKNGLTARLSADRLKSMTGILANKYCSSVCQNNKGTWHYDYTTCDNSIAGARMNLYDNRLECLCAFN